MQRQSEVKMANTEDHYFEKISSIQHSMHQREKRRLELERELFAYSKSDQRILQIKSSKLRSYLKKISDREAHAKTRNLELLRDVESIQISMKEYCPDQHKEFFRMMYKRMKDKEKMDKEQEAAKIKAVLRKHVESSVSHPVQNRTPSPIHHQSSEASPGHLPYPSPDGISLSPEHPPSGLLRDGEDAACLSDDISGSTRSPDTGHVIDKHQQMSARVQSACAASGNVPSVGDNEPELSPPLTFSGSEENTSRPTGARDSPEDQSHERANQLPGDGGITQPKPEVTVGEELPDNNESLSTSTSDVESESSASDLSLSLTQSEPDQDLSEDEDGKGPRYPLSPETSGGSTASPGTLESLSQEGLFNLLDSIEGRLGGEWTRVYCESSHDGRQLDRIIGRCNGGEDVSAEDLGACGAVVLRELQMVLWRTGRGCMLTRDIVKSYRSCSHPDQISASLPPDAARLWDRWFKHALLLKERNVLNTQCLVQLFTPLLMERHASYGHQAKVLLRTLLSRSSEESPSAGDQSHSSSSSTSSFGSLRADRAAQSAKFIQKQHAQELQSAEEDSQDESPVESVPIRETKAYQLLKQSAMQERQQSSEEEEEEEEGEEEEGEELSGINGGREEDPGRAKRSSHQDPYPRTEKTNSKAHSAAQSKALWTDPDDIDSEIEAALRPRPFNTNND